MSRPLRIARWGRDMMGGSADGGASRVLTVDGLDGLDRDGRTAIVQQDQHRQVAAEQRLEHGDAAAGEVPELGGLDGQPGVALRVLAEQHQAAGALLELQVSEDAPDHRRPPEGVADVDVGGSDGAVLFGEDGGEHEGSPRGRVTGVGQN